MDDIDCLRHILDCIRRIEENVSEGNVTRHTMVLVLVALLTACLSVDDPGQADLLITDVTVVDVESGSLLPSRDILISEGIIRRIGASGGRPPAGEVLDGRGLFVLPGLWDMHVHTAARDVFFPLYLAHGVTGVRDMGGDHETGTGNFSISLDSLVAWRNSVERGEIVGPRLVLTGPLIDGPVPVWPGLTRSVDSEEEARELVRSIAARGADFIKVYSALPSSVFRAIRDESEALGLPFAGHVPRAVSAIEAARLGQRSMEHLNQIVGAHEGDAAQELFDVLKENDSWQTPTFTVYRFLKRDDGEGFLEDPRMQYVPSDVRRRWAESSWWHAQRTEAEKFRQLETWKARLDVVKRMHAAGVPILAGSDSANPYTFPGSGLHDELESLVEAGLTPLEALQAATLHPARFLGAEDSMGSVAAGKVADLVILSANPLEDVRHVRRVEAVVARGRLFDWAALEAMLDEAALRARD